MKNLIIFSTSDPLGTARRISPQDIRIEHGNIDAKNIMDGTHAHCRALYADVFLGKLRSLLKELEI